MPLVRALFVPNAPTLIAPSAFAGASAATATALHDLRLAERLRPEAVVVVSPHWVATGAFHVDVAPRPKQIYDFAGFPPSLERVRYAPPGDPPLGRRLVEEGTRRSVPAQATEAWGLDHGAWAPLLHLLPAADVPVVPTSIQRGDPDLHVRWGAAIAAALADEPKRVLLVATGSVLHNFARMNSAPDARWPEGEAVDREITALLAAGDVPGLLRFDRRKWAIAQPEGDLAPGFVLLGAVGDRFRGRIVSSEFLWGGFSLTTIDFAPAAETASA